MRRSLTVYVGLVLVATVAACSGGGPGATAPTGQREASARGPLPLARRAGRVFTKGALAPNVATSALGNGGFETGSLAPWTKIGSGTGAAAVESTVVHSGSDAVFTGTTTAPEVKGYYGIEQPVTIPSNGVLAMYVQGESNDSISYVDQEADLVDSTGTIVKNCFRVLLNTTTWTKESCDVSAYAGKSLTVFVGVYGTGYSPDYLDLYADDVTLVDASATPAPTTSPSAAPTSGDVVGNSGFETGALAPWTQLGTGIGAATVESSIVHSGSYAAVAGTASAPEVNGLYGVRQAVTIPTGGVLSLYVRGTSNDSITYADQEADLLDSTGSVVYQCFKALLTSTSFVHEQCDVSAYAGRALTVFAGVKGNGYSGAYVGAYLDDITLAGTAASPAPSPSATASPAVTPTPISTPTPAPTPTATPNPGGTPIQHVVIILQENRTLENIFHGFPGASTVNTGLDSNGNPVTLQPVHLMTPYDPAHRYSNWLTEYNNGGMNGFNNETLDFGSGAPTNYAYEYALQSDVQPYWDLAKNGVLGDETFADHRSQSFAGHQFPIAGASGPISTALPGYYASENPRGGDGCATTGTGTAINIMTGVEDQTYSSCFDYKTIADLLTAKGKSWAYYIPSADRDGAASGFAAIRSIRNGPAWTSNVLSPETNFFSDLSAGKLANVTYVVGTFANSDHAGQTVPSSNGPAWVTMVANAVGASAFWKNTTIILAYDDWGGWYDEAKPTTFNAFEPGFRIPLVVVSPYAKRGTVDHTVHYMGSVLHYIESTFGLGTLGTSDSRSDDLTSMFDYGQTPLPYTTITSAARPATLFNSRSTLPLGMDRD